VARRRGDQIDDDRLRDRSTCSGIWRHRHGGDGCRAGPFDQVASTTNI
jgi:hypothetical protein